MRHVRVHPVDLEKLSAALLSAAGAGDEPAAATAELLCRAELRGHPSHGIRLVGEYCDRLRSGRIDPGARLAVERDDGSTVLLDGRQALGQVAGTAAVDLAVERARRHGVAVVTMRRSGHLGRLADYVERAADAGLIAILVANDSGANQVVAPHGSAEPRLATNPIAVGIPRAAPPHFVLDMSTSVVSHGTVEQTRLAGSPVPEKWSAGDALLPLGGAKGTGLALVVEVLAGILSAAGWSGGEPREDDQGLCIVAVDPLRFLAAGALEAAFEELVDHVHSAHPLSADGAVLVPGEAGALAEEANRRMGVKLSASVWDDLAARARDAGIAVPVPMSEEAA